MQVVRTVLRSTLYGEEINNVVHVVNEANVSGFTGIDTGLGTDIAEAISDAWDSVVTTYMVPGFQKIGVDWQDEVSVIIGGFFPAAIAGGSSDVAGLPSWVTARARFLSGFRLRVANTRTGLAGIPENQSTGNVLNEGYRSGLEATLGGLNTQLGAVGTDCSVAAVAFNDDGTVSNAYPCPTITVSAEMGSQNSRKPR